MSYNPILALIGGLGRGVQAIDERHAAAEERQRAADEARSRRALEQLAYLEKRRDAGFRPSRADDLPAAADAAMQGLLDAGPQVTPGAINVPGPRAVVLPGQKAPPSADAAMLRLVGGATPARPAADPATSQRFAAAARDAGAAPTELEDVYGRRGQFVFDPNETKDARAQRNELERIAAATSASESARARAQADQQAATRQANLAAARAGYNTLKLEFPDDPLAKVAFDEKNPADYDEALAAARQLRAVTAAQGRASDGRSAANEFRTMGAVAQLRSQFDADPVVKNAKDMAQSYSRVQAAAADPSPAGDLSLIFAYMKMLDPGSTVREGEFASAQNAAGVPDQLRNMWNRALKGERLNPAQRADFLSQAAKQATAQRALLRSSIDRYASVAQRSGLDARDIVFDPFDVYDLSAPGAGDPEAAWATKNPPRPGESFEAYHARYLQSRGGK